MSRTAAQSREHHQSQSFSEHAIAQLVAGYSEECTLYQMLFGLTSRQRRCLGDGGDLTEFVELIGEKDRVLGQITALEAELDPLRSAWISAGSSLRDTVAERLNPVFDEIITTIQRTVELEKDNECLLERRRTELQRVLSGAHRWRVTEPAAASPVGRPAAMMA
jgi:hypothetical protein